MDYTLGSIGDLISGSPTKKKVKNAASEESEAPIAKKQNTQSPNNKKKKSIGKSELVNIMQSIQNKGKKNKKNSISEDDSEMLSPSGKKNKNKSKGKNLVSPQGKRKNSLSDENIENNPQAKKRNKKNSISENKKDDSQLNGDSEQTPNKKNKQIKMQMPIDDKEPEDSDDSDEEMPEDSDEKELEDSDEKEPEDSDEKEPEDSDEDEPEETENKKSPNKKEKLTNAELRIKGKESKEKQKIVDELRADTKDQTIFVGNVSIKVTKKKLLQHFAKYGNVETLRFRSIPLADTRTPKKVAAIKKEFHADRNTLNAYVQFSTRESAVNAIVENGKLFEGTHIRVDLCSKEFKHDDTKAIFIGNLSFTAEDEALWELFKPCGEIESVRIVRDKRTNVGKGFGYVNFASSDSVALALQMDSPKLNNRELRISLCDNKKSNKQLKKAERKNKKEDESGEATENGGGMVEKKKTFPPKNKQFQGSKFTEKKKKNKINKGDMKKKNMAKKFAPKENV